MSFSTQSADMKAAGVLMGDVIHRRVKPKINAFKYGMYYVVLPLEMIEQKSIARVKKRLFGINNSALLSFFNCDHGYRDHESPRQWLQAMLSPCGLGVDDFRVVLVTLPRVLGYVFNPVSFWLCLDDNDHLRAVICEVNNTFGESHTYVCLPNRESDRSNDDAEENNVIEPDQWMTAEKCFHVSPFIEREGSYRFRFDYRSDRFSAWINYYDGAGEMMLATALSGDVTEMTNRNLVKAFFCYPLVTVKAITMIHWQALKIFAKGIAYIPKPAAYAQRLSRAFATEKRRM